jgi:SpoVK/Ycf46/Vps4 family AAA+-type ATPase
VWSSYQGLTPYAEFENGERAKGNENESWVPPRALQLIREHNVGEQNDGIVYLMRDFHGVLTEPIVRQLKDLYRHMEDNGKSVVVVSPLLAHGPGGQNSGLPPSLEKLITVVHYELPHRALIETRIKSIIQGLKDEGYEKLKVKLSYTDEELRDFSRSLQGMTMSEVEHSVATSLVHLKEINTDKLISDKRSIIRKSQILEFIDTDIQIDDIGGLDKVKEYFSKYKQAFTEEAEAFGVEPLRGVLLVGVPGAGRLLHHEPQPAPAQQQRRPAAPARALGQ